MALPDFETSRVLQHPGFLGLLGGVFSLRWCPGAHALDKVANVGAAVALSYYAGPVASEALRLTDAQTSLGGLVLGLFGISLADAVVRGIRSLDFAKIADSWLLRR